MEPMCLTKRKENEKMEEGSLHATCLASRLCPDGNSLLAPLPDRFKMFNLFFLIIKTEELKKKCPSWQPAHLAGTDGSMQGGCMDLLHGGVGERPGARLRLMPVVGLSFLVMPVGLPRPVLPC